MTKLKDQKQKIALKENTEEYLPSNRSTQIYEQTAIKRSARPMVRD